MELQELHDLLDTLPEEAYPELLNTMTEMKTFYEEVRDIVIPEPPPKKIIKVKVVKRSVSQPSTIEE